MFHHYKYRVGAGLLNQPHVLVHMLVTIPLCCDLLTGGFGGELGDKERRTVQSKVFDIALPWKHNTSCKVRNMKPT